MHPVGEAPNSPSPSFNSYFDTNIVDTVARVTAEFPPVDVDGFFSDNDETKDDFEFNLTNSVPAESIYPVFDRDLLRGFDLVGEVESRRSDHEEKSTSAQIRLQNLFLRDGDPADPPSSSCSEEEDDLDEIPPGTYCVWAPNKSPLASPTPSPSRCTKSNSTGSSVTVTEKVKAWRLRDILKRSKSDGKDRSKMIFLTPKKKVETPAGTPPKGTAAREGNKRRSYLPYRQNLVGFSVSPHALRKMHIFPR